MVSQTNMSAGTALNAQKQAIVQEPLISSAFVWKTTITIATLLILTILIHIFGRYYSATILDAGNSKSTKEHVILIGQDELQIPENTIRFANQRQSGATNGINLYLSWPEMDGYGTTNQKKFANLSDKPELIFVTISPRISNMDMSARFAPIYKNFTQDDIWRGPNGLIYYHMNADSIYNDELLFVEKTIKEHPYVIKCLKQEVLNVKNTAPMSTTGCQRDINLGQNLVAQYRFSAHLLPQWQKIENDIENKLNDYLIK